MRKTILLSLLIFALTSCDVLNQIGGAIQLSQCEYKYNSINDIQLAGINLGDGSSISLSNFASISSILTGGSLQTIPFSMTLNMDVKNPNQTAAFLNALEYAIDINEMEFTTGKMDVPIRVEPGQTSVLPISIGVDLKNLINRYSRDRVAREMSAFLGLSSDETKVTVKLWPKLMVGNTPIKVPAPIPVVFSFGGDK
ncbi:MAG: LEA type 2 family protein [Petrimonas sp.]|jgi:LEA14-like dessication related protein